MNEPISSASQSSRSGHEHMDHGAGEHVMPDGGVMEGHEHPQGATHVMPDGSG